MEYFYVNSIVGTIGNGLVDKSRVTVIRNIRVEVFLTWRKIILVGVDYDLYNKPIPIGASKVDMDLLNVTVRDHTNESVLLQGDAIYLLSIDQVHYFDIAVHEAAGNHNGKQYTHVGDLVYLNEVHLYQ